MSTQRDSMSIRFADGTKGLIITEISTGKLDLTAEYEDELVYYCADHVDKSWVITRGSDKTNIGETATRKEAIAQIILDVRKNQVRTARKYILTTVSGREFEVVATSEVLAKKAVRFKCDILPTEELYTKEIKNEADETKQKKAKIGEYADFICEKDVRVLNDNTTMMIERTTGGCDITITTKIDGVLVSSGAIKTVKKEHVKKVFYWVQLEKGEWVVRLCVNGFYYNSVELNRTMTKKDAILTVIERHTSNHWYDFGNNEECFVTDYEASEIGKVVADYKQEEIEYIREYDGQHFKAYPNGYVFECDDIEEPKNTIKTEEEEAENEHFVKQMSDVKGGEEDDGGKSVAE